MADGTHMLGHMAKYRETHYEVHWREKGNGAVTSQATYPTEAEANLKALKVALGSELAWNAYVEVFEVVVFEERLAKYDKESAERYLATPRAAPPASPEARSVPLADEVDEDPLITGSSAPTPTPPSPSALD